MKKHLVLLATAIEYRHLPNARADDAQFTAFLNITSAIAAAVALLFLVIGGFRYIISRGDPQGTARARDTIIYSVVGLVVVIVAFSIITFVLNNI